MIIENGEKRGMRFPRPIDNVHVKIERLNHHNMIVEKLAKTFRHLKQKFQGSEKQCFILCVIPGKQDERYSQVKQAAEREGQAGVLTQCVKVKNFENSMPAIVNNILLKLNAKLGGINHVPILDDGMLSKINILKYPTLILGMDVNHPSLPTKGRPMGHPSFASVTGSLDRTGMPYMMHIQAQLREGGANAVGAAEVIEKLDSIVKKMLLMFKETTNCQPCRIIVFRDGVGETQFPEASLSEPYFPSHLVVNAFLH